MAKQKKESSFEDNLEKIETIISSLNNDNLPLQKAIELHTEAMELIKNCESVLQNATLQFETLQ
jgi:exodeoxyribonuclease VII small subunit